MAIDLRHFRSFVVVAEEGNIGRAARRLFITQPALSRQIQQLERSIGSELLIRSAHGVELTEAGREMLVRARRTLEAMDDALAVGQDDHPRGRLGLGLTMAGRRDQWYEVCEAFAQRYPDVEVEARHALSEPLQQQVASGELDGALVLAPSRLAALTYTVVRTDRLEVWMHQEHPLAARSELGLDDLDGQAITLVGGPSAGRSGFNLAVRALFDDSTSRPEFVETPHVFPARAVQDPAYLGISPPLDFPGDVVGVPLVPARDMAFEFAHRKDGAGAAVRAFAPFAADYFRAAATRPCPPGMTRA